MTRRRDAEVIVGGGTFFEGPRWWNDRWWVSDFFRHTVFSFDADGGDERVEMHVEGQPSGLGWDRDGSLLVVSMLEQQLLRRTPSGKAEVVASLAEHCNGGAANDMVVDALGRAWIGNYGFDMHGGARPQAAKLLRVNPDKSVHVVATDLRFPNGSVITPDGGTLIVGESGAKRYTAFTIAPDGTLHGRREWATLPDVTPDGCALDAEGRIWVADALGARCLLVQEGGRVLEEIPAPAGMGVYACMLGGATGTTLLQCCAPGFEPSQRRVARDAVLVVSEVDVPGAGWP